MFVFPFKFVGIDDSCRRVFVKTGKQTDECRKLTGHELIPDFPMRISPYGERKLIKFSLLICKNKP
jgi:hypothetical protein